MRGKIFSPPALSLLDAAYPETPVELSHALVDHPLLTLDAIVALACRLPANQVEYNAGNLPIGIDPADIPKPLLSITDTVRNIEANGAWMVLKLIEADPAYRDLLHHTLATIRAVVEPKTGEMLTLQGFLFVSATHAVTPFHFDPEHNILLQIRGSKVFTIFPQTDEAIVPPEAHERFHMGEQHRNLVWKDELEPKGNAITLAPGDGLHVPVKAPHFVRVIEGPSISLSVTWRSEWSYREADARAFNRLVRKSGLTPASPERWPNENLAKSHSYRAIRKLRNLTGR
jgi:Cupin-like domain